MMCAPMSQIFFTQSIKSLTIAVLRKAHWKTGVGPDDELIVLTNNLARFWDTVPTALMLSPNDGLK